MMKSTTIILSAGVLAIATGGGLGRYFAPPRRDVCAQATIDAICSMRRACEYGLLRQCAQDPKATNWEFEGVDDNEILLTAIGREYEAEGGTLARVSVPSEQAQTTAQTGVAK
jgi:hypothetical protein